MHNSSNIDSDDADEFVVTRKSNTNSRYFIYDDYGHGFRQLLSGGSGWNRSTFATSVEMGDVDGDGRDEIGITLDAASGYRYLILDDKLSNFNTLLTGGENWGAGAATDIAFGDVDSDGRDEVGITRNITTNLRYLILDDANEGFRQLHSGGHNLTSQYATGITFGNIDADVRDEIGITLSAASGARYIILQDSRHDFRQINSGGEDWGPTAYATDITFGDIDGDGRIEYGVTRFTRINARVFIANAR